MVVVTQHSRITAPKAAGWINASIAAYLIGLWIVRDRFLDRGWRTHVLLAAGLVFVAMAAFGVAPWYCAALVVAVLAIRR
jgi:hypothetical protein